MVKHEYSQRDFRLRILIFILLVATGRPSLAVQSAGIPTAVPPGLDRKVEIFFGNDFFGAGDYEDDYRTQQLGLTAEFADRWLLVIDHSILTLEKPEQGPPGRLDQLSASAGYRFLDDSEGRVRQHLDAGAGFRYSGDIAGARIQNGFHQILSNSIKMMPYVDTERVDATVWAAYDRTGQLATQVSLPLLGDDWQLGYWARAATLLTTDGQWDGDLRLAAVAGKGWFESWLGMTANGREGYDRDNVQRETARTESGAGVVIGLRFGPFLLETEQRFGDDTSYGHLSFVSTGEALKLPGTGRSQFSLQTGLTVPDVYATLQGRWANCQVLGCADRWRRSIVLDTRFGSPQYGNASDQFVETLQGAIALEYEVTPAARADWFSVFAAGGIGWRTEKLTGEGMLTGQESDAVQRAGVAADLGLRLSTMAQNETWRFRIQLGLSGWLPTSDGTVQFAGSEQTLQRPELVWLSGVLLEYSE